MIKIFYEVRVGGINGNVISKFPMLEEAIEYSKTWTKNWDTKVNVVVVEVNERVCATYFQGLELKPQNEIWTCFGSLYYTETKEGRYRITDSEGTLLWYVDTTHAMIDFIDNIKKCDTLDDWLFHFDNVCWGSKENCLEIARSYQECNGRKFDENYARENINKIGNTYVLFNYDDCYVED